MVTILQQVLKMVKSSPGKLISAVVYCKRWRKLILCAAAPAPFKQHAQQQTLGQPPPSVVLLWHNIEGNCRMFSQLFLIKIVLSLKTTFNIEECWVPGWLWASLSHMESSCYAHHIVRWRGCLLNEGVSVEFKLV